MTAENENERIVTRIVEEYCPLKIILFGSYAYGAPNEDSDIDLLIIGSGPISSEGGSAPLPTPLGKADRLASLAASGAASPPVSQGWDPDA